MKTVLLNSTDVSGGAAIAAYRLHKGLRSIDVDSQMMVRFKFSDDPCVIGPSSKWGQGFSSVRWILDNLLLKIYRDRGEEGFSLAMLPGGLPSKVDALEYGPGSFTLGLWRSLAT